MLTVIHCQLLVSYRIMLKIITVNVNGIRSAARKGFFSWISKQNADLICLQETRCGGHTLDPDPFYPKNYHAYFFDAEKKGYSGVAIYSKHKPNKIHQGLGWNIADNEGRYLQLDFNDLSVASLYLPSGTSGEERQTHKYDFLNRYETLLRKQSKQKRNYIICGDWNIAHKNIDLKNWRANQKNSGFLPEERAWLDTLFDDVGFIDAFREINPDPDEYTWWSNRGRARENNVGWRIDYQIVTPRLKSKIHSAHVYKEEFFSDHAPLIVEYDLSLT